MCEYWTRQYVNTSKDACMTYSRIDVLTKTKPPTRGRGKDFVHRIGGTRSYGDLSRRRLCRQRLGREVKPEHAAIHLVHVHEAAGDVALFCIDLIDACDGHPADPFAL